MFKRVNTLMIVAVVAAMGLMDGCGKDEPKPGTSTAGKKAGSTKKIKLAFITNVTDPFWHPAVAGVKAAEKEFNVETRFYSPPNGSPEEQLRELEDLKTKGFAGVAISPLDPANQVDAINEAAKVMNVICHDSDAAESDRLFYLGTSNVEAGRKLGELVKEVLPDGGKLMMFVGKRDMQNAKEREQGVREVLTDPKYKILGIKADQGDQTRAKQNAEDTLNSHPDIDCMVGLWGYNSVQCLNALKDVKKEGKVHVVSFDHLDGALQGIKDGYIHATVVQQPYEFGYQSIKYLAQLARGEAVTVPGNRQIPVDVLVVRKDNVDEYWEKLRKLTSGGN